MYNHNQIRETYNLKLSIEYTFGKKDTIIIDGYGKFDLGLQQVEIHKAIKNYRDQYGVTTRLEGIKLKQPDTKDYNMLLMEYIIHVNSFTQYEDLEYFVKGIDTARILDVLDNGINARNTNNQFTLNKAVLHYGEEKTGKYKHLHLKGE